MPFTISVFNSKKAGKSIMTMEVEFNQNQENLLFKALENISIAIGLGDTSPDEIEL